MMKRYVHQLVLRDAEVNIYSSEWVCINDFIKKMIEKLTSIQTFSIDFHFLVENAYLQFQQISEAIIVIIQMYQSN